MIPPAIRNWVGARLSGPPRGSRARRPRACLYALGRLGDFVLVLSTLRLLIREFGADNCVLVVPAAAGPIAAREFPSVRCITLPTEAASLVRGILPAWWRHREKFAGDRFQHLVCLSHQRSLYYEVTLSWIDAEKDARLMPATYPAVPRDDLSTELLAHWRLAEIVLGRPVDRDEILPRFISLPVSDDGRLLVYPLSSEALRSLPIGKTVEVLRLWRERSHAPIVFGGSPAEAARLEGYAAAARQARLTGISVELPAGVDRFLEHIARAGAVLTCETGAAHVATALDKPSVVMTGGGLHGYCYPWRRSVRQVSVQNPLPCFGCSWNCTQTEMFCLTGLPMDAAAAALPVL
jgi:ADP-heptose:LPS heptosyltransferase